MSCLNLPAPAGFSFDHFYSDWAFQQAQDHVLNYAPRCLYDVGGNTGKWALSVRPGILRLSVTILDLPEQLALARPRIEAAGLADRVRGHGVNMLEAEGHLPGGGRHLVDEPVPRLFQPRADRHHPQAHSPA